MAGRGETLMFQRPVWLNSVQQSFESSKPAWINSYSQNFSFDRSVIHASYNLRLFFLFLIFISLGCSIYFFNQFFQVSSSSVFSRKLFYSFLTLLSFLFVILASTLLVLLLNLHWI